MPQKARPRRGFKNILDPVPLVTFAECPVCSKKLKKRSVMKGVCSECGTDLGNERMNKEREKVKFLGAKLGIYLYDDLVSQTVEITSYYLSNKEIDNNPPHRSEVKAALKEISDQAEDILERILAQKRNLNQLDFISRSELLKKLEQPAWADKLGDTIPNEVIEKEQLLSISAKRALEAIPFGKGGRPKKPGLQDFIQKLAKVFKKATGEEAKANVKHKYKLGRDTDPPEDVYTGLFYKFVETFLKTFAPEDYESNTALGQQIRAALKAENL